MSLTHPEEMVVIFPRKEEAFQPFELVSSDVTPTKTKSGISVDAVRYRLRTFDLAPKQAVLLPYAYLIGSDTIQKFVRSDSLQILFRIPKGEESGNFQAFEGILTLPLPPNYSLWILIGIILLILLFILAIFLRQPLDRYLKLQRLKQEWMEVRKELKRLERHTDQSYQMDQLNHLWKEYLDQSDEIGLLSMTTTELQNNLPLLMFLTRSQKDILLKASQVGDQVIYAGESIPQEDFNTLIWELHEIIDTAYEERKEKIIRKN